ncbi:hypothetical protein SAMN05443246_2693 [Paenibacillus sp. GP183]|nr:hypothetical protein SAMN05443246_2693 [Paenibacillus sp. GP183]
MKLLFSYNDHPKRLDSRTIQFFGPTIASSCFTSVTTINEAITFKGVTIIYKKVNKPLLPCEWVVEAYLEVIVYKQRYPWEHR